MRAFKKILCAVDFLQHSPLVAEYSKSLAKTFGADIIVVYVSPVLSDIGGHHEIDPMTLQTLEEDLRKSSEKSMADFLKEHFQDSKATGRVVRNDPAEGILAEAAEEKADLIIMGTLGRKGLNRLLFGSVAEKVVTLSPIPVLTIRTPE